MIESLQPQMKSCLSLEYCVLLMYQLWMSVDDDVEMLIDIRATNIEKKTWEKS